MRKETDHRFLNPKYTVWKAFMLYLYQHLIICLPFRDTWWRIDISNSSGFHECSGGNFAGTTSLGWTLLISPACGKSKENWSLEKYHLEARIPETRGGILNCYYIVFYTVPQGDCSEWLESHLELIWFNSSCRKRDYSRYAPPVRNATADIQYLRAV